MNKKALVISIDQKLCEWLYHQLKEGNNGIEAANDLLEGLSGLKENEYGSLIINKIDAMSYEGEKVEKIKCGNLLIDGANRSVYYRDQIIQLTPKEFDILYLLASNKGKVYSKHQIYNSVWKESYTFDDSNIMAHIRKLRKKIEPNPKNPIFILTVWGVGYKCSSNIE